jgi:hypothetical protein
MNGVGWLLMALLAGASQNAPQKLPDHKDSATVTAASRKNNWPWKRN